MLRSSLCDYNDAYILVKEIITVAEKTAAAPNNTDEKVIFKNSAPLTNCMSRINNTQIDDVHDIAVVMPMYNLIKYNDNYSKTSRILWQYRRLVLAINAAEGYIADFSTDNDTTDSFKNKAGQTANIVTKNVEKMVPLKYLSHFLKTLEMLLIDCEINLDLNWSENCVIVATAVTNQGTTFSITGSKIYVRVVTLSTQDNGKLLEQLKSGFKLTIHLNKY